MNSDPLQTIPVSRSISPRQRIALVAIALATAIAVAFILLSSNRSGAAHTEGAEPAGHATAASGASEKHDEGLIVFTDAQVVTSGIAIQPAGAASIRSVIELPGEIRFNEDRTAHVVPRVNGVVDRVSADLGQRVKQGQVLAVLSSAGLSEQRSELLSAQKRLALARTTAERERKLWQDRISAQQDYLLAQQALQEAEIAVANAGQKLRAIGASPAESLARYELRAPFDGMVVEKHLALGESVKEDSNVFTVSDLSTVWAQISVSPANLPRVRVGEKVAIRATAFNETATGTVAYVGALLGEQTRVATARVTLPNPSLSWRPGLFVTVEVVSAETQVPVAVAAEAVQTMDGKPVVFVAVPGGFRAQPITLGRADAGHVEVLQGLDAGARYAAANAFIVKAQQGKGSAGHAD